MPIALPIALGVSAAASLAGAGISAAGAQSAAKTQEKGLQAGINEQQQMFNTTNAELSPYFTGGAAPYATANKFLTGGPGQQQAILQGLPGYQFERQQGLESTQNSYAARGLGSSGAALKGAANFATGLANNNWSSFINPLLQSASIGENAAAQSGYQGTSAGQGISQSLAGIGQAGAAGTIGASNALAGGLGGAGNALLTAALLNNGGMYGATSGGSVPAELQGLV